MRRALALLAVAGGIAALFATAARPDRHGIRLGSTATASAACYTTSWTKGSSPVTRRVPCAQASSGGAEVAIAPGGLTQP